MLEYFAYKLMQLLGYRYFHHDRALHIGVKLDKYSGWTYRPDLPKGTYRETRIGYEHTGNHPYA